MELDHLSRLLNALRDLVVDTRIHLVVLPLQLLARDALAAQVVMSELVVGDDEFMSVFGTLLVLF